MNCRSIKIKMQKHQSHEHAQQNLKQPIESIIYTSFMTI